MSVKIGVVGLGIGATHVASLKRVPDAEIVAVADLDADRTQKFASELGANAYPDWRAMLAGEMQLDAVVLATPAKVRKEPIEAICARGIALFCEKPPAVNLAEAREISEIITRAGNLNTVGFMYRWSPVAVRMRELVSTRPRLFARGLVAWPVLGWVVDGHAPKSLLSKAACGGPLVEQAIHYQDVLRFITGDEPVSVQATAELGNIFDKAGRDCEETTAYTLRHESGMLSTHIHNWSYRGTLMELQVVGENFNLTWHMDENQSQLRGTVDGQKIEEGDKAEFHYEEIVGFVDAVKHNDQSRLRSPYSDACKSMAVCEVADNAIATGCIESIN